MTKARPLRPRPVVLCVLDGWGHRAEREDNAIAAADTPVYDRLMARSPHALIHAAALDVGLPQGQMGNSEVGHMNLGAGRMVMQDMPRIDAAIADGSLAANPVLARFLGALAASGGACHILGLLSPGGVHSHQDQIGALVKIAGDAGIAIAVHAFLDGRDTPPASAREYLAKFEADIEGVSGATIATVCGRYYAMDRDRRWDRTALAYAALLQGKGKRAEDALKAVAVSYASGVTDEFMQPNVIAGYRGMKDGDGILMGNFRADRVRQILTALLDADFDDFARPATVRFAAAAGMVENSQALNQFMDTIFPPLKPDRVLGQVVAGAGMTQLRIAETEKYAHVTFFFDGGEERRFPGEERILVPSPKVATYDLKPEMSARGVTVRLVAAIKSGKFDFILVNYANADMVGHSGDFDATVKAVQTVDACLGRLEAAALEAGGVLVITADHGNAEMMRDAKTGQPHTAHTRNAVPVILVNAPAGMDSLREGRLADIAPTVLELLGLPQPREMTGRSLLVKAGGRRVAARQRATA
ncbi:MAG: 2,3-bisphosphoglycerate-independent phosphoglycerate mutase [Alphaproteobacteria bacterium]